MPSKDKIKPFNSSKKPAAKGSKASPAKKGKVTQYGVKKSTAKKPVSAKKNSMPKYHDLKLEVEERHKIEHLQNKEEKRIARNESRKLKLEKSAENKVIRKQKRAERKRLRKEGMAYTFSDKVINEVIGIIIIGFGVFMFMCLFGMSTGFLGDVVIQCMHGMFGYFAYVLPVAVIIGGVILIAKASLNIKIGKFISFAVGVLLLGAWLQLFSYDKFDDDTFAIFMKSTYYKGLDGIGTGLFFSWLTYLAVFLFGEAGANVILFLGLLLAALLTTNRSLGKMSQLFVNKVKERDRIKREKEHEFTRSGMKNVATKPQRPQQSRPPVNNGQPRQTEQSRPAFEPPVSGFKKKQPAAEERYEEQYEEKPKQARPAPQKSNVISFNRNRRSEPVQPVPEAYDDMPFDENESNVYGMEGSRPTITEMPEITGEERVMNMTVDGEILDDSMESVAAPVDGNAEPSYIFPSLDLLETPDDYTVDPIDEDEVYAKAAAIEQTLSDFGISAKVINITHGPVITRYECSVPSGTKMSKVTSLDKELAYSLECASIRIEAPIPNKAAIGIEVPNKVRSTVYMRELLESQEFVKKESLLAFAVGKDIAGNIIIGDIAKMPHTLICGATGSGKSVFINSILLSILYKASPMDVKLIMVDPKKVEFEKYRGIPHLLFPVVSNPKRAAGVLGWCVKEMEDRYEKMAKVGVRDLRGYNQLMKKNPSADPDLQPMPLIVIVVDELSDLMVVAGDEVEDHIYRLAQMARAAGMYLLIATQRPSVDVVTGVIKANIPSRIALKTSSSHDSRTILDTIGAEQLLGNGDMIYKPANMDRSLRVQGAWVSDDDVERVVEFVRSQNIVSQQVQEQTLESKITEIDKKFVEAAATDELLEEAIAFVVKEQEASVSMLQRRFRIGHGRAGNLIDEMEKRGVVGAHVGSKPREVLLSRDEYELGFTAEDKDLDY